MHMVISIALKPRFLLWDPLKKGGFKGNLILVASGDLVFGGRQSHPDKISFTKLDHIIANEIPGVILTKGRSIARFK